jgi:2-polyprenyl-6-methoxyphenol hydroxylase-like FAD-dependent oxidoreductase
MKINQKILVCGASISGTAIAFWLEKYGYQVVVIEKFNAFRDGGQNVDIKGIGQDVIKLMGLEQEINSKDTGEKELRYLNDKGNIISSFPKGAVGGLTSSYEILHGDLARIIYEKTRACCEYRFGTFVTNISETTDAIKVTFNNGSTGDFGLVICADGIGSTTRDMVMHEDIHFNYLGAYMSFFKIPKTTEDDLWAKAYQVKGGAMVFLRPGYENDTTVLVTFLKEKFEKDWMDVTRQKKRLKDVLSGKGGIAERVAQNIDDVQDLYFGPMSQVKASKWSKGRVVLLGDAAHAPTPFTGLGTALSLVGAYILAGELQKNENIQSAFLEYMLQDSNLLIVNSISLPLP